MLNASKQQATGKPKGKWGTNHPNPWAVPALTVFLSNFKSNGS